MQVTEHKRTIRSSREDFLEIGRARPFNRFGLNLNETTCNSIIATCKELERAKQREIKDDDIEITETTMNNRRANTRTTTSKTVTLTALNGYQFEI